MAQIKTRKMDSCPVFGMPKELNPSQLPTYCDVMKYYMLVRNELKPNLNSKEPTFQDISLKVANKIKELWVKASIPTVIDIRIVQLIRAHHDKYKNLMKSFIARQNIETFKEKLRKFKEDSSVKFDIFSCKCKSFESCTCGKDRRVPNQEMAFLIDQRTERKMIIGSVDLVTTKKEHKKEERKARERSLVCSHFIEDSQQPSCSHDLTPAEEESISKVSLHKSHSPSLSEPKPKQMRLNLSALALACDRTGVSDRSAAIIASAVLQDVGLITPKDKCLVVDRSKLRRERMKMRSHLREECILPPLLGLYFDGRKDNTMTQEKKGLKYHQKLVKEEHYVLVSEPGSTYFGHVTCHSGSAMNIKTSIIQYLSNKSFDVSLISAVGCDGTVVNTGSAGGVIRFLEEDFKKPLQ